MARSSANTANTATPQIEIDAARLSGDIEQVLYSMRVELTVHGPSTVHLVYRDPKYALFDDDVFEVGAKLEVKLPVTSSRSTRVFTGEITSVGIEQAGGEDRAPRVIVEATDRRHRFVGRSRIATYLSRTRGSVIAEIADEYKLKADVELDGPEEEYLLQSGTDAAFLDELARTLGCEWFVDGDTLFVRRHRSGDGPELRFSDGSLLRFSARYSGRSTPEEVTVRGWSSDDQDATEGVGRSEFVGAPGLEALGTDAAFATTQHKRAKAAFGTRVEVPTIGIRDQTEGDLVANAVGGRLVGSQVTIEGVAACCPSLRAGGKATIAEVARTLEGTYYVTDVTHVFGPGQQLQTSFVSGPSSEQPRPATARGAAGHDITDGWGQGLVVGIVSDNDDQEGLGRVQVYLKELGNSIVSEWARVVYPGAGQKHGMEFRPAVGDEVLVGFHRGDFRFPFVLGGLYSAKGKPAPAKVGGKDVPIVEGGETVRRVMTSTKGHQIVLSDGDGGQACVEIHTGSGKATLQLRDDGILLEADAQDLVLKSGKATMTLGKDGEIALDCEKLTVKAQQEIGLDAKAKLAAKAGSELDLSGMQVKVKGSAGVKVDAGGGMAEVKGTMVKLN